MKLRKVNCPSCNGMLDLRVDDNQRNVFCPYCGQVYEVDCQRREIKIKHDVRITHDIRIDSRHTDEAAISRAQAEADIVESNNRVKRDALETVGAIAMLAVVVVMMAFMFWGIDRQNTAAREKASEAKVKGMISAGYYGDYIGIDYEAAEASLRELGFNNIVLIDLKDSGFKLWKNNEVDSISIGGDSDFGSSDYFYPADKVIIKYH